jgi:hypothetical protein
MDGSSWTGDTPADAIVSSDDPMASANDPVAAGGESITADAA